LEDFEMQILNKMKKAAQAQKEATPTATPTDTPSSTPSSTPVPTPTTTPIKPFPSFTPDNSTPNNNHNNTSFDTPTQHNSHRGASMPIDVDNPTATHPIYVDKLSSPLPSHSSPIPSHPIIDLDATNTSTEHKSNGTNNLPYGSAVDFESVTAMKLRQAAERKKLLDELEKSSM
jgi:hypothetical protein